MPPRIRLATLADAPGCLALYRPFVAGTAVSFETVVPTQAEFQARMADVLQRTPWLVCEEAGRILGYGYAARYRPRPAYRWSVETTVYLAEPARGRGLGRALYGELLARLRRQGFVNAYAAITLPNPASVALHERLGYVPLGVFRQVGYKLGRWHDVGWWHLQLQPPPPEPADPAPPAPP
jgi:phosphinothricin acetyltransferase